MNTKTITTCFAAALAACAGMAQAQQNISGESGRDPSQTDHSQQSPDRATSDSTEIPRSKTAIYLDDAVVTAKVKSKFAEDGQVRASTIKVETRNGVVSLSGNARSDVEKTRAEEIARDTNGAKDVSNRILVK